MGYLDSFLGASCWHCNSGYVGLLDKGFGVHLACSKYPVSCQFISVAPVECPGCANGSLIIEHHQNKRYLRHPSCGYKSEINVIDLKIGKKSKEDEVEIQKIKDHGVLLDYLSTLNFAQLSELWDKRGWEDPIGLPISENIEEQSIRDSIQKVRSAKWKILNKSIN